MSTTIRTLGALAGAGAATFLYGSVIERNAFVVRNFDVPVLAAGAEAIRVLHVSDLHITARQHRKHDWIRGLARLRPDLVVNTGDTLSGADAIPAVMRSLEPLFEFPGVFVPGNNDYYVPRPKSPLRYFRNGDGLPPDADPLRYFGHRGELPPNAVPLPWPEMARAMVSGGWTDLTHVRTSLAAGPGKAALTGIDDPHLRKARYRLVAGPADVDASVRIGVMHSPEPGLLGAFASDGYDLVLAGHTHGGQVRVPFGPAVVTNCGIDRGRARWLHAWDEHMYFHVSAGLGTNPYTPLRLCCRPEATLLTLVPRAAVAGG